MELLNISAAADKKTKLGISRKQASANVKKHNIKINLINCWPEMKTPGRLSFTRAGRLNIKQQ